MKKIEIKGIANVTIMYNADMAERIILINSSIVGMKHAIKVFVSECKCVHQLIYHLNIIVTLHYWRK